MNIMLDFTSIGDLLMNAKQAKITKWKILADGGIRIHNFQIMIWCNTRWSAYLTVFKITLYTVVIHKAL